jgi:hypothetical protein
MAQLDENKAVDHKASCELFRGLSAMVTAFIPYPAKEDCDNISRNLIAKYPCLLDLNGSGFGSWAQAVRVRIWNINRKRGDSQQVASVSKKGKRTLCEIGKKHAAPPVVSRFDPIAQARNEQALQAQLKKLNPRNDVSRELFSLTYTLRRAYIVEENPAIVDILSKHPL